MNINEAIEVINNIDTLSINDMIAGQNVDMVIKNQVIDILNQIDTQPKVVVPRIVAEWIEECKLSGWHLEKTLNRLDDDLEVGDWVYDENDDLIPDKVNKIARAWLDGYKIEQEKLYTVEIPNNGGTLVLTSFNGRLKLGHGYRCFPAKLTEEKIREKFNWAWQFAKPVPMEQEVNDDTEN